MVAFIHNKCQEVAHQLQNVKSNHWREKANAPILQTAKRILHTLKTKDLSEIPHELQQQIYQHESTLQEITEKIAQKKSQRYLDTIQQQRRWAKSIRIYSWTRIYTSRNQLHKKLTVSEKAYNNITSNALREQARQMIEEMRAKDKELLQKQHEQYQKWALNTILKAFQSYSGEWVVSEKDAKGILKNSDIKKIDFRYLSPATARAINNVLQKLFATMGAKTAFTMEKMMLETRKETPEKF